MNVVKSLNNVNKAVNSLTMILKTKKQLKYNIKMAAILPWISAKSLNFYKLMILSTLLAKRKIFA